MSYKVVGVGLVTFSVADGEPAQIVVVSADNVNTGAACQFTVTGVEVLEQDEPTCVT